MNKRFRQLVSLAAFLSLSLHGLACPAEDNTAATQVSKTLKQFVTCMAERDGTKLATTFDVNLQIVEAGSNAQVHLFEAGTLKQLLPPEGNDDWKSARIEQLEVQVSTTNPSIAIASYRLVFPIDETQIKKLESLLNDSSQQLPANQRSELARLVKDKSTSNEMFAMLCRKQGGWRIVSMTVPK
jgi:hypothetical protein